VGHIRSFCFWFDRLNRRTGLTRHYHLRRILESISSARLATLAFASLMDSRMEFTEATLHAPAPLRNFSEIPHFTQQMRRFWSEPATDGLF
jgi:hypothetical protein